MKACYSKQKRFENQVKPRVIFAWVKDIALSMAEQFGMGYKKPGFIITKQSGKEKMELSFIIQKILVIIVRHISFAELAMFGIKIVVIKLTHIDSVIKDLQITILAGIS
jgi:hypothetical protein